MGPRGLKFFLRMGLSGTGHRGTLIWLEKSLLVEKIDVGLAPPLPSPVNTLWFQLPNPTWAVHLELCPEDFRGFPLEFISSYKS